MEPQKISATRTHLGERSRLGFQFLLVCLVAMLVIPSFFEADRRGFLSLFIMSSLLFSCLYLVAYSKQEMLVGALLVLPVWISSWWFGAELLFGEWGYFINGGLTIAFLTYVAYLILRYLFETPNVSSDMLYASLCLYLLIGLIWVFIYFLIELALPGSFAISTQQVLPTEPRELIGQFSYYSYVTLSTLGYGDIAPVSRVARSWASLEALVGQFYLAVVMARIVALYIPRHKS